MQGYAFLLGVFIVIGTLVQGGQLLYTAGTILVCQGLALWYCRLPLLRIVLLSLVALAGSAWGHGWLENQIAHRLPASLDKTDVDVSLIVESVEPRERWQSLVVRVIGQPDSMRDLRRLHLNYYQKRSGPQNTPLQSGDYLDARVRLKAIRSFSNGLPFDYEAWLLRQSVDARGYIRTINTRRDAQVESDGIRTRWLHARNAEISAAAWPWVAGLVFGEQSAFSAEQWQLAQQTGTLHLLVVSGLHMGMIAGFVFVIVSMVRRLVCLFFPLFAGSSVVFWAVFKAIAVLVVCSGYVYLAGAGIALQRAMVMLLALVLVMLFARRLSPIAGLSYAFAVLLLMDPLVYTGAGFGFSICAVGGLLAFMSGRRSHRLSVFWQPQWVVFLVLLPVMLFWGQSVSLIHVMCNTLAIPLLGFVVLPLAFATALFPGGWWEFLLASAGEQGWRFLSWANTLDFPVLVWQPIDVLLLWVALLGLVYVGARPVIAQISTVSVLVMLFLKPAPVDDKAILLDVGQGQAMVFSATVGAKTTTLVIDTGPRFSARFNAGSAMIAPMVRRLGADSVDDLVVSHDDLDHTGGWQGLMDSGIPIERHWFGQPDKSGALIPVGAHPVVSCHGHRDKSTVADGWIRRNDALAFRFLQVPARYVEVDNDASCVVQVDWHGLRFLVPGDISRRVELALVAHYRDALKSDVLVLAHHGSRSSSAAHFVSAVAPNDVLVSAGFNNRFGHPHEDVMKTVSAVTTNIWITANDGAIHINTEGHISTMRSGYSLPWRQH